VIDGMTAKSAEQRKLTMIFTIDEQNNITAFGSAEEAAATTATPFDSFGTEQEFAELVKAWPAERLVAIWNSLPGVTPVKKFNDCTTAATRIWKSIQDLGETAKPEAQTAKPKAARKAKGGAQAAKGASATVKATMKATPAKNAPQGKRAAKTQEATAPREGSKTTQVVRCSSRRTEPLWSRSWRRWAGNGIPSAGSWPAR
jgi:hypothetical protein